MIIRLKKKKLSRLKEQNLELNAREYGSKSLVLESLPVSLYVDVNLKCNLRCPSCFRSDPRHQHTVWPTMILEIFQKVARELFPTACRVILSGGGESLLHKDFDLMLELCLDYMVRPVLYTNATTLSRERLEMLARAGTCLGISIDGASQGSFEKLRYPAKWDRMIESLEMIRQVREEVGNRDFFCYFGVVVQKDNLAELGDFVDLAREYGFEQIKYTKLDPYYPDLKKKVPEPEEAERVFARVYDSANKAGIRLEVPDYGHTPYSQRLESLRKENRFPISLDENDVDRFVKYPNYESKECQIPWSETMITPEGRVVVSCCSGFMLGDLARDSFNRIWNSEGYQELRRTVNSPEPMDFCRPDTCPFRK